MTQRNKRPDYVAVQPVTPITGKGALILPGNPVPVDHLTDDQINDLIKRGVIRPADQQKGGDQ